MKKSRIVTVGIVFMLGIFALSGIASADWTYTVKRGDTFYTIARKTGITVTDLRRRNGITGWSLRIGQRVIVPSGVGRTAAVPTRTSGDALLLAHLIQAEAGGEPYLGKVAVGGVIMNRLQSPRFPKTIAGIIYQPSAFESVSNGTINQPASTDCQKAARDALSGWDPSGGALFFFNPAKTNNPWIWARRIINRIGKHVFAI